MKRFINIALILAMIAGAAWTYQTKHQAAEAATKVASLRRQIEDEKIRISLLKAEWSTANQPGRLQGLVDRFQTVLKLAPYGLDRMVRLEDVPMPTPLDADALERLARANPAAGGRP